MVEDKYKSDFYFTKFFLEGYAKNWVTARNSRFTHPSGYPPDYSMRFSSISDMMRLLGDETVQEKLKL